ncbi:Uncharacterized protein TCM_039218 [Theobroma cacao]|uniref:Uncharacterized protein n=1 Tax=Theobroma cacao TaxID=3641 RepID=A0A061GPV6_THECC|nr:Uncharacterized protein TCM_039218 [Theobroma cacao]
MNSLFVMNGHLLPRKFLPTQYSLVPLLSQATSTSRETFPEQRNDDPFHEPGKKRSTEPWLRNKFYCPITNIDKLWPMVPHDVKDKAKGFKDRSFCLFPMEGSNGSAAVMEEALDAL